MIHCIIDFETMGVEPTTCAVVDCSAFVIDDIRFTTHPYTLQDIDYVKRYKLSVTDQVKNYGYAVEKGVIDFWGQQPKEVRARVAPKSDDLTVAEFTEEFHKYISWNKIDYWWTRGNSFDPVILTRLFDSQGKKELLGNHLKYYAVRDMRTFIDAKFSFNNSSNGFVPIANEQLWEQSFKQHDSSWDVLADVLRMQAIVRAENDLEQIDGN